MGREEPGRKAKDQKEEEDLFLKLAAWLQRSKVLEELTEKALYKVLLKLATDKPLYHAALNHGMK
jgi:uncharacterized protein YjgD (DUF1641 family)